jgi:hypothetical protein
LQAIQDRTFALIETQDAWQTLDRMISAANAYLRAGPIVEAWRWRRHRDTDA